MNKEPLQLRDYIFMSLVTVVFGVIYLAAVYLSSALKVVLTPMGLAPLASGSLQGIWYMAPVFTIYFVRKPFVGILTEITAALVEVLIGNMFGVMVLVSGLIQGVAVEAGFAVTGYKDYSYKTTMLGATFCALATFVYKAWQDNYLALDWKFVLVIFVVRLASSLFFTGFLAKFLCDKMKEAGVVKVSG